MRTTASETFGKFLTNRAQPLLQELAQHQTNFQSALIGPNLCFLGFQFLHIPLSPKEAALQEVRLRAAEPDRKLRGKIFCGL